MMASVGAISELVVFFFLFSFPDRSFFFRSKDWCRAISDRENGRREREAKKLTGLSLVPSIDSLQGPVKSGFCCYFTGPDLETTRIFFLPFAQVKFLFFLLSLQLHFSPMGFFVPFLKLKHTKWNCKPIHCFCILISLIVSLFNSLFQL